MVTDNALAQHIAYIPEGAHDEANAAFIVRAVNAHDDLVEACRWFMAQLEDNVLVRDTSKDGDPDYHVRMMRFVGRLAKAAEAIAKAEATP